jgi:Flp pilus assembly protein TadG
MKEIQDSEMRSVEKYARASGKRREKGAELIEFTFSLLPYLVITFALLDIAWAVFVKSTFQQAVRSAVRYGVTITSPQLTGGACLTDTVKSTVQQNALGLLSGSGGLSKIKVNYLQPPPINSTASATDVSTQANANAPGNIMQVSVQGYSLLPLVPRIFSWNQAPDVNPMLLTVYAADLIEPSQNPPCVGTAP